MQSVEIFEMSRKIIMIVVCWLSAPQTSYTVV